MRRITNIYRLTPEQKAKLLALYPNILEDLKETEKATAKLNMKFPFTIEDIRKEKISIYLENLKMLLSFRRQFDYMIKTNPNYFGQSVEGEEI